MNANGSSFARRVPKQIRDRWAFDVDSLMPLNAEDIECLQSNTVVQIWLRRVQKRRQAKDGPRLRRKITMSRSMTKNPRMPAGAAAAALRVARRSLSAPPDDPASVEALLARPFNVRESQDLRPILASGEGSPPDLWVLSKSYWLETILDGEEFPKWAKIIVSQYNQVRKQAGVGKSGLQDATAKQGAIQDAVLQMIEEKRLARGSLPFAVPLPLKPLPQQRAPDLPTRPRQAGPPQAGPPPPPPKSLEPGVRPQKVERRYPVELPSQRLAGAAPKQLPALRGGAAAWGGPWTAR